MKKLISVALLILLTLVFAFNANAHPGRTDSDGGHYDRSTGEYHYHHGRPAHDHPNGKCPYDDEDIYEYNFSYTETTADSPQWDEDIYEESSSYTETTAAPIQTTDSPQRDDETYEESFSNTETTAAPIQTANSSQWEKLSYFLYPILVSVLACIVIVSFYIGLKKEVNNLTQGERVKYLRKELGLTLEKFGDAIGLKKSALSLIENGKNALTEANTLSICREFNVNEEWLRTGNGEWRAHLPEKDEIASIVYGILQPDAKNDSFYNIILSIVDTYQKLSPQSQEVIREFINQSLENIKKREG